MTRLVERPDAGCAEWTAPAASRAETRRSALTVGVLGDCELVAQGLSHMLSPFSARVRVLAASPRSVPGLSNAEAADSTAPDVILFDCYAGGVRDRVLRARPAPQAPASARIVAYTWETREDLVSAALRHGYSGVIGKALSGRRLVEALECVGRGERVVCVPGQPPDLAQAPVKWSGDDVGLTPREADVLDLIAAGHANAEIAESLHVSINSVKSYVRSAYRKIGATSRSQAVLWGISQGLGNPSDSGVSTDVRRDGRGEGVESAD